MSVKLGDLFPIGTVVKLKKVEKRLVVMGIMQQINEGEKTEGYDYVGVPYPEGFINGESMILFQHEDIESIIYLGFADIERQAFLVALSEKYKDISDK